MSLYRITDWDVHFETDETRKRESLRWVPMPNKHDGLGFRLVASQRNAAELYAAWVLMLQIASKAKRGQRGVLARDGEALTADDMAIMTGFPKDGFARALTFFTQKKVGWITVEHTPDSPAGSAVGDVPKGLTSVPAAQSAGAPADDAVPPADDAGRPVLNGREGIEENRKEEKGARARGSLAEIVAFCESEGLTKADGESRFHAWEANGWKINGKPMRCWKSSIRSWASAGYLPSQKETARPSAGLDKSKTIGLQPHEMPKIIIVGGKR